SAESADRILADQPLGQAQGCQQNGKDQSREGDEDRRPQTVCPPQDHGSARLPWTAGRVRAGDSVRVKFTFATSSRTSICRAVSSGFTLLRACHTVNV